jgi:hypothetical protein
MVHALTTVSSGMGKSSVLASKGVGEGKAYFDPEGLLHSRYGVEVAARGETNGAIFVIRPDTHIAYRVQGLDDLAWKDVDAYFESILV